MSLTQLYPLVGSTTRVGLFFAKSAGVVDVVEEEIVSPAWRSLFCGVNCSAWYVVGGGVVAVAVGVFVAVGLAVLVGVIDALAVGPAVCVATTDGVFCLIPFTTA